MEKAKETGGQNGAGREEMKKCSESQGARGSVGYIVLGY